MTRILKASDTSTLDAVPGYFRSDHSDRSAERSSAQPLSPQVEAETTQANQLAELRKELENLHGSIPGLVERAEAKGREEGKAAVVRDDAQRLTKLSESLGQVEKQIADALGHSEWLAAMLVRELLGKMFADSEQRAALIEQAVRLQYQQIESKLIRKIHVSSVDFPDGNSLEGLAQHCRGTEVVQDNDLAGGECRLELKLGYIDLSLPIMHNQLQHFVDSLMHDEGHSG